MKRKRFVIILVIIGIALGAFALMRPSQTPFEKPKQVSAPQRSAPPQQPSSSLAAHVPAHFERPPGISDLAPTLPPEKFTGVTREAYKAAQEIPETLAQLPCYCYCDQSVGHKSLHSCFEDGHAANCAVCTSEALMADKLQKEGLSVPQIRERIITQYSRE